MHARGHVRSLAKCAWCACAGRDQTAIGGGMFAVQLCSSLNVGNSTRTFREYGMSERLVGTAWLAGPLAGIFVQPAVGMLSDRTRTRWGRRRPYMAAGLTFVLIALLAFSNADLIGSACGEPVKACGSGRCPAALGTAVASFVLLDCAFNFVLVAVRTAIVDLVPLAQQGAANVQISTLMALGSIAAFGLGTVNLMDVVPQLETNLRALYTLAAILALAAVSLSLFAADETSARLAGAELMPAKGGAGGASLLAVARSMPRSVRCVCLVQACTWFAWFTSFIYAASWVGSTIYAGQPQAAVGTHGRERYDFGVRLGNAALCVQATVALCLSVPVGSTWLSLFSRLARRVGTKRVYALAHAALALALTGTCGLSLAAHRGCDASVLMPWVFFGFALLGFAWAATVSVPWAVCGVVLSKHENKGLVLAAVNLSQCVPELLAALCGIALLSVPGGLVQMELGASAVMGLGGLVALLGAALVLRFRVGDELDREAVST